MEDAALGHGAQGTREHAESLGVAHLHSLQQSNQRLDALSGIIMLHFDMRIKERVAVLRHDGLIDRMLIIHRVVNL